MLQFRRAYAPAANTTAPPASHARVGSRASFGRPTEFSFGTERPDGSGVVIGIIGLDYVAGALPLTSHGRPWGLLISCVTDAEADLALGGTRLMSFAIEDRHTPPQMFATIALIVEVLREISEGHSVLFGCGAGCGRSGMLVACLLAAAGGSPGDTVSHVDRLRRASVRAALTTDDGIIETVSQRAFVDLFARAWSVAAETPAGTRTPIGSISA